MDLIKPLPPKQETNKTVAIIGSGPAGLAAAQQLRRVGHEVTVLKKTIELADYLDTVYPNLKWRKTF